MRRRKRGNLSFRTITHACDAFGPRTYRYIQWGWFRIVTYRYRFSHAERTVLVLVPWPREFDSCPFCTPQSK